MMDQPCPDFNLDAARFPLYEPGKPMEFPKEAVAAVLAIQAYLPRHDWAWQCRYQADNIALRNAPSPQAVFMGDSITEAWIRYDPQFFAKRFVDRGISGQTTPQMLLRFRQDVVALRPRVVHIMAGTNDIAGNTGPTSPQQVKDHISSMVDLALSHGIAVVLGSITPIAPGGSGVGKRSPARIVEMNGWLKSYAAGRGLVYADYYAAMAGPDGSVRDGLTFDGLHPGTAGYRIMRPIAARAIASALRHRPRRD